MTFKSLSLITATLLLTTHTHADETLEPITIVSATKTTQSIENTTSNVTVITADDIEEKGYQTVAQALEQQTGMIISRSGGIGQLTSIFTRGMNSGQTLVLLDGMRLNDPSTPNGAAQLETLTTANIQQIEIVKGGSSSIWGSNASAGVINIITKTPKNDLHGSVSLGYGSYNTREINTDISYKDEKLSAHVLGSYLKTDGFSSLRPRDAEKDGYENKSYNLKLGYTFNEKNKLSMTYNDIETDVQYDGYDSFGIANPNDNNTNGDTRQKNYGLNHTFISGNYSAILNASKSDIERTYITSNSISSYTSLNQATSKEYSLINQYRYDKNKVVLGLEYKDIDGLFDSEYVYMGFPSPDVRDANYKNKAVFLSSTYYFNENTLLETNLRYDSFNNFDDKTTYKIGLKNHHTFLEGFTTSANYYTAYDAPTIYQLAEQSPTVSVLKPMSTEGFDISVAYKKLLTITYFNNKVEDAIDDIGGWGNPAYVNVEGTEKFEGIELEGAYTLSTLNINISANYTHLFKYEKDNGTKLTRRPKDTLNATIDYYTENDMHFGINTQYIGDRLDTDYSTFPASEVSTGNYTLWNLYFDTKLTKDFKLNLTARNIFDKEYQSVYGYATEGQSLYAKIKYSF